MSAAVVASLVQPACVGAVPAPGVSLPLPVTVTYPVQVLPQVVAAAQPSTPQILQPPVYVGVRNVGVRIASVSAATLAAAPLPTITYATAPTMAHLAAPHVPRMGVDEGEPTVTEGGQVMYVSSVSEGGAPGAEESAGDSTTTGACAVPDEVGLLTQLEQCADAEEGEAVTGAAAEEGEGGGLQLVGGDCVAEGVADEHQASQCPFAVAGPVMTHVVAPTRVTVSPEIFAKLIHGLPLTPEESAQLNGQQQQQQQQSPILSEEQQVEAEAPEQATREEPEPTAAVAAACAAATAHDAAAAVESVEANSQRPAESKKKVLKAAKRKEKSCC